MKIVTIIACVAALTACSHTDLQHATVRQVAGTDLTDISMTARQSGCEQSFIAVRNGRVVQGCLYRPAMIVGPLQVRWL